jgi:heptosyltransferase-3
LKFIPANIILSRTDSIGDMVLTLPMAKVIKEYFPHTKVFFLGREYTRAVVDACIYADGFIELNDFLKKDFLIDNKPADAIVHVKPLAAVASHAKKLKIKWRIGTTNRIFHWHTCNKLVKLSRKRSNLHEAQLNLKLLHPFGIKKDFCLNEIQDFYGLKKIKPLDKKYAELLDSSKYNLILHPKSRGSAREWGLDNFELLIFLLDKTHYKIFISGTEAEKKLVQPLLDKVALTVTDITGQMSLPDFVSFIAHCDGIVACSTGPLHIAAALGKEALGIYAPLHSIRPQRWGPVGAKAVTFSLDKKCTDCFKNKMACHCIQEIAPQKVKAVFDNVSK